MEQNNTSAPRHTAGPWYAKDGCIYSRAHEINYGPNPGDAPYIWRVVRSVQGKTQDEISANEDLIAAAPDMYEALRQIATADYTQLDVATLGNIARAALAKAVRS